MLLNHPELNMFKYISFWNIKNYEAYRYKSVIQCCNV